MLEYNKIATEFWVIGDSMELIVDLHIHSRYERATSKDLTLENIYKWCKIKGINVVGTGTFTHPAWFEELQQKLEPAEYGLFKLKDEYAIKIDAELPHSVQSNIQRFILVTEISNIYSKNGKTRRLHNLIIVPDFVTASQVITRLSQIGNLKADGRPILGLDSKELLKIVLEANPMSFFIPAHIWTPWFAMFGSKSGFDSVAECFDELASEIHAIETGLSSDPFMNWRVSQLHNRTITSGSDAHSLLKLAREANILNCQLDYRDIIDAFKTNDKRIIGTIEFFPDEGMYHYDGHRKCGVSFKPSDTKKYNGICPQCGTPLVVGVLSRVNDLADQPENFKPVTHKTVEYAIPLIEILAEIRGVKGINTRSVLDDYARVYSELGSDFDIIRKLSVNEIESAGFVQLAHALKKVRSGDIYIKPGYDGVYGIVKVFAPGELQQIERQLGLGF